MLPVFDLRDVEFKIYLSRQELDDAVLVKSSYWMTITYGRFPLTCLKLFGIST